MTPLILREGAPAVLRRLSRAEVDALIECEVASLAPTVDDGVWAVSAAGRIGVVRVGDLEVIVQPKLDIERLVFMMGYARNPTYWRDDRVHLDPRGDLPEALAESFRRFATRALGQGLLKGYLTVDDTTSVLRGRIREADQIRQRFGRMIPLEVTYNEFTVDVAENQILLAALHRILRMPSVSKKTRQGLQRLRLQLVDVSPLTRGARRPSWQPSRLNARYVPALRIAEMILDGHSFEQRVGTLLVSGFLVNMAKIFEDFVCVALREALKSGEGRGHLQYATHLDRAELVSMRPDFVWSIDRAPVLVVDAKYKAEKPSRFPNADLYQLLAYCTVLGIREGHLVYAQGEEMPRLHEISGTDVRIHRHTLDLALQPDALLAQVQTLADRISPWVAAVS